MNLDLDNDAQAKIVPFYQPVELRERQFYLDEPSDDEKADPYANLSPQRRARIQQEDQFQQILDKLRKRKADDEKIRLRNLKRQQKLFAFGQGNQEQGGAADGRDQAFLDMAAKIKPTKPEKLPALNKELLK